jgi:hypothetical protein
VKLVRVEPRGGDLTAIIFDDGSERLISPGEVLSVYYEAPERERIWLVREVVKARFMNQDHSGNAVVAALKGLAWLLGEESDNFDEAFMLKELEYWRDAQFPPQWPPVEPQEGAE